MGDDDGEARVALAEALAEDAATLAGIVDAPITRVAAPLLDEASDVLASLAPLL